MVNKTILKARKAVSDQTNFITRNLRSKHISFFDRIADLFENAYQNPILTTAEIISDDPIKSYAGTGGWECYGPPKSFPPIPQDYPGALYDMWVRDACAQYHAYLGAFKFPNHTDPENLQALGSIIEGVVRTCSDFLTRPIKTWPYTNITKHAFDKDGSVPKAGEDYEPDSLAYLAYLAYEYEKASGSNKHLDHYFWEAMEKAIEVINSGQYIHNFDKNTVLTRTPFRPSDDKAERYFNIPVNAFIATAMENLGVLAHKYGHTFTYDPKKLGTKIRNGIITKGVYEYKNYGEIFSYETDAGIDEKREPIFMDDAGIPSLLSLPYLSFCNNDDIFYRATRQFLFSKDNPYYFEGIYKEIHFSGIGSPHTQEYGGIPNPIWPMAIIMQGMTTSNDKEVSNCINMVIESTLVDICICKYGCDAEKYPNYPAKGFVHESFAADNPTNFTRGWFAWVNALFGEWIFNIVSGGKHITSFENA